MFDMHVHTSFSCDSKVRMDEYCEAAIEKGCSIICFTDHADNNTRDFGCGYFEVDKYFEALAGVKSEYGGRLKILSGVEFAEPHVYKQQLSDMLKYPFDYVLGSIHFWIGDMFVSEMLAQGIPLKECFDAYWNEMLKVVQHGGFDSVGHFDFPKRYYKELLYDEGVMAEIMQVIVKNGIVLEINTSSLRKGVNETMPNHELLLMYKKAGGRFATIGSDAHMRGDLTAGNAAAQKLLSDVGIEEVYFEGRKMCAAR